MSKFVIDHAAIFKVACLLRTYYERQEKLLDQLINDPDCDVVLKNAEWINACEIYQTLLQGEVSTLAKATNNSEHNLKLLFRIAGGDVTNIFWTPEDILNVARFESFNSNYWHSGNAVVRNKYEFPA